MAFLTVEYCSFCSKETDHVNSRCAPCLKKENSEQGKIRDKEWIKMSVAQKLDYLYKRIQ